MKKTAVLSLYFAFLPTFSAFSQEVSADLIKAASAPKSSVQRVAAGTIRRNHDFSDFGREYSDFKNYLTDKYGFDYGIDVSYMPQRGTPSGRKTAYQTIIYPYFSWTTFDNKYGTGTLNFAYTVTTYGGVSANHLADNIGVVTGINDYTSRSNGFDELYYTYQLGGDFKWLTLALGQFPIYNFDGTQYDSNQQVNFINYSLAQNASSTYPTASLGSYIQINPNDEWSMAVGAQDATNVSGQSIKFNNLNEEHYTTFGYLSYSPNIEDLGAAQYSVLLYNQPSVKEQKGTTNGWSLNFSQDIGEKLSFFARLNGVSGNVAEIETSFVLGAVYNNPLNRNPLDQIGLAFSYNKINEDAVGENLKHEAEKVIETYWAWGVSKWMTITPDVQFYIDPALNQKSDYGAAFSLRATLMF